MGEEVRERKWKGKETMRSEFFHQILNNKNSGLRIRHLTQENDLELCMSGTLKPEMGKKWCQWRFKWQH